MSAGLSARGHVTAMVSIAAALSCWGCAPQGANKGAVVPKVPTPAQQAMVLQTIQNNPNIPPDAKASAINSFNVKVQQEEAQAKAAGAK
jgi:hypothetical protein